MAYKTITLYKCDNGCGWEGLYGLPCVECGAGTYVNGNGREVSVEFDETDEEEDDGNM